jgi:hypothetical protein
LLVLCSACPFPFTVRLDFLRGKAFARRQGHGNAGISPLKRQLQPGVFWAPAPRCTPSCVHMIAVFFCSQSGAGLCRQSGACSRWHLPEQTPISLGCMDWLPSPCANVSFCWSWCVHTGKGVITKVCAHRQGHA